MYIASFEAGKGVAPERLYVRAFAETQMKDPTGCGSDKHARRAGACIRRYAFANPVWAVPAVLKEAPRTR